jgi:hypothetical protein
MLDIKWDFKVYTPVCTLLYPYIFGINDGSDGNKYPSNKYEVTLVAPDDDWKPFSAKLDEFIKTNKLKGPTLPLKSLEGKELAGTNYDGHSKVSAKSFPNKDIGARNFRMVAKSGKTATALTDAQAPDYFYAGALVQAKLMFGIYKGNGISCYIDALAFVDHGNKLDGEDLEGFEDSSVDLSNTAAEESKEDF